MCITVNSTRNISAHQHYPQHVQKFAWYGYTTQLYNGAKTAVNTKTLASSNKHGTEKPPTPTTAATCPAPTAQQLHCHRGGFLHCAQHHAAQRMPLCGKGAAAAGLGVVGSAADGMSVAMRPWWKVLLLRLALLSAAAAGAPLELSALLGALLGAAGMAAAGACMLALKDSAPPACAALLTQSSWNGFCSGRLLHLKHRSRLSNLKHSKQPSTRQHAPHSTRISLG